MKLTELFERIWKTQKMAEKAPEGYCPNCWGHQELGGKIFERALKAPVDTNNSKEKLGWIQSYAKNNITGIELKMTEEGEFTCNACKLTYKESELHSHEE